MFKRRTVAFTFAAIVVVAILFSFPAVRAAASDFLGLFRVQKFAAISVSPEQLAALEQLADQGMTPGELEVMREPGALTPVDSLDDASRRTGLEVRAPASLGAPDAIYVVDGGEANLRVDLASARALVEAVGADPSLLPDNLDGARVHVTVFPGVQQSWGETITLAQAQAPRVEYPADIDPTVLGEALLQVLGTEPREARRLAHSIDWASTLLLPIPRGIVTFSEVTVDGASGAMLSPIEGAGGALLWQKEGQIFVLNTEGDVQELLAIADSLN